MYKMLLLDVDGVLTDGSIFIDKDGEELKRFNVKDGLGIKRIQEAGCIVGVITGRASMALRHRLNSLNVSIIHENIKNKLPVYEEILKEYSLRDEDICYMGDDLPDLPILKRVGFSACPEDAVEEVKNICKFCSKYSGGNGAVRELTDALLSLSEKFNESPKGV